MYWRLACVGLASCQLVFSVEQDPVCSTVAMITDPFDDDTLSPVWEVAGNDSEIVEVDGALEMRILAGAGNAFGTVTTKPGFDFRGQSVTVDIEPLAPPPNVNTVRLSVLATSVDVTGSDLELFVRVARDGTGIASLEVGYRVDVTFVIPFKEPYDPDAHRRLRIARDDDDIDWSVAGADGVFRSLHRSTVPGIETIDTVRIELGVFAGDAVPFTARFDNLNGGGPPTDSACRADELVDGFTTIAPARWKVPRGVECVTPLATIDDRLVATFTPGGPNTCYLETHTLYNLLAGAVAIEVIDVVPQMSEVIYLEVVALDGSTATLQQTNGQLSATAGGAIAGAPRPFEAALDRWWRMRADARDLVVIETSSDGRAWSLFGSSGLVTGLDSVVIKLGISGFSGQVGGSTVTFDNLNVTP